MVEYITRCPCGKHNILSAVKAIKPKNKRLPQRISKCYSCKKATRMTIIGEVVKVADNNINSNAEFAKANTLTFRMWNP